MLLTRMVFAPAYYPHVSRYTLLAGSVHAKIRFVADFVFLT
jgi:hypothetical protein